MSQTLYCEDADVNMVFGRINVDRWADVDNVKDPTSVAARRAWAIEQASAEFDDRMRNGPLQAPILDPFPPIVVRMVSYLAGVLLYESRGVVDMDAKGKPLHVLSWAKDRFDEFVRDVHARRIAVDAVLRDGAVATSDTPDFVSFPDPSAAKTLEDLGQTTLIQGFMEES